MKKILILLSIIFTLLLAGFFYLYPKANSKEDVKTSPVNAQTSEVPQTLSKKSQQIQFSDELPKAKVARVIDGDTIEIEGGQKVRYIGIDTPETVDPRQSVGCFGKEASSKNKELVEGKEIRLEKDVSETDKYERLLRYVYVDDLFVNDYLVRQGYATSYTYPPDIEYQEQFRQAEQEARENNRGLWGTCPSKENQSLLNQSVTDSGCNIKGNISSSGEKIYHTPGQKYYDKTVIDESKGERWFCTEEEALNSGWRKSKI